MTLRRLLGPALLFLSLAGSALAAPPQLLVDSDGVAANGYDVVAYFDGEAVRGIPDFSIEYRGATWYFESPDNAARFRNHPERFEPRFGGYCAYGVSQGYLVGTDPEAWSVIDGALYLNYNPSIRTRWLSNVNGYIATAERHWPRLIE